MALNDKELGKCGLQLVNALTKSFAYPKNGYTLPTVWRFLQSIEPNITKEETKSVLARCVALERIVFETATGYRAVSASRYKAKTDADAWDWEMEAKS